MRKGFAVMSKERQRAIASLGGKASQASGRGHRFTSEEARAAGRKGGSQIAKDRNHMVAIGRKGGAALRTKRQAQPHSTVDSPSPAA